MRLRRYALAQWLFVNPNATRHTHERGATMSLARQPADVTSSACSPSSAPPNAGGFFFPKVTQASRCSCWSHVAGHPGLALPQRLAGIQKFNLEFVWRVRWDIVSEEFGAAIAVVGTLVSATVALLIADAAVLPASPCFLTETCPVTWLRRRWGPRSSCSQPCRPSSTACSVSSSSRRCSPIRPAGRCSPRWARCR